ncbi:hydrogenase maturation protease [candidate division WOR-3 bacterium]|nr:hydrogenase maturation protease [candidate division WOR-3 bacterium]
MRVVVCGIGNVERGDDMFGPFVVARLNEGERLKKIDCGLYPENYLNEIVSLAPDMVIFLDTVRGPDKTSVLLKNDEILGRSFLSVSTHNLSLAALYGFLKGSGVKEVCFVGVPVRSYAEFSPPVRTVAERLITLLNDIDKMNDFDIIKIYEALSEQLR